MPIMESLITNIIAEFPKITKDAAWKKLNRDKKVLKFLKKLGIKPDNPEPNFESIYAHTLVEYGIEKPAPIQRFFGHEDIQRAFRKFFEKEDPLILNNEIEHFIESNRVGDDLRAMNIDPRLEVKGFTTMFNKMVDRTRTPAEIRRERKLDKMIQFEKGKQEMIRAKDLEVSQRKIDEGKLLKDYLNDVIAFTSHIDIQGISSTTGAGRGAMRFPIEEHYTPLKTVSNPAIRGEDASCTDRERKSMGEARRIPLTDLLSRHRRLLIIGEPGGGKTTFLRFIACVLAKDAVCGNAPGRKRYLGLPLDTPPPVPIFIRFSALARTLRKNFSLANSSSSWRVLVCTLEELFGKETACVLIDCMEKGECALLLDGLDEEPDMNLRKQIVNVTNGILHHWGKNMIVLTSRPFGYQAVSSLEEMSTSLIDAFSEKEIVQFLSHWANALFPDEEERRHKAYFPELKSAVLNVPRIRLMARNPVMLTCLCVVHWNERKLPEGKADLLAAVLSWLINAKEEKRKDRGYHTTFAEESFKALALFMTNHPQGKQVNLDISSAAEQLKVPFRDELGINDLNLLRRKGMKFLESEMLDSGIIEQSGEGQLRFWHLTFQEHYAAKAIVELGEREDGWWPIIRKNLYDRQWDEVIDHFSGCLAKRGRRELNLLIERVIGTKKEGDLPSIARAVGVLGRILSILKVYDYKPPEHLGWEKAQREVMEIFTPEGASRVTVEERIAAADALGGAGDPRFKDIDPEMFPIPGMEAVHLGKYPVTVLEYRRFVENGGYEEHLYWDEGWEVKIKKGWKGPSHWDEQSEHPNRPVIYVSWYEAKAYCKWLSQLTGLNLRLPTSREWGKAAHNPQGEYPWGKDEPCPELLNFNNNVGYPTPVGIYPAGDAPGGHSDMAGNVWEWVEDDWHDSYKGMPDDGSAWIVKKSGHFRVMRGGSWNFSAQDCRSAIRFDFGPDDRYVILGFRLSRSVDLGA